MRFLTIIFIFVSTFSFGDEKYPARFFQDWKAIMTMESMFLVTSDVDRVVYLLENNDHVHSNVDERLFSTRFVNKKGESIDAFFNPDDDKNGVSDIIFIGHINPEDENAYDFLLVKNEEKFEWDRVPQDIFPKGDLAGFLEYMQEKTGLFITLH